MPSLLAPTSGIKKTKDGYKSVDYSRLTPVLVEAIKELNAKNEVQQKVNEAQQKIIKEMQDRIEKLGKK